MLQALLQDTLSIARVDRAPADGDWLTPGERAAQASLRTEERRADFRAGRAAARLATAGLSETTVRSQRRAFCVSIAHTDGRAAAVASYSTVGIDLEREHSAAIEHTRYFLSPRERPLLADYDATTLWTLKEAAWKALRLTTSERLLALELRALGGDSWVILYAGRSYAARAILQCNDGYRLTVLQLEPGRTA